MLSDKVLERLTPHIKQIVPEPQWHTIGDLFEKVYLLDYDEEHEAYVIGYWGMDNPLICFDTKTYSFLGVVTEEYVYEHGTQI